MMTPTISFSSVRNRSDCGKLAEDAVLINGIADDGHSPDEGRRRRKISNRRRPMHFKGSVTCFSIAMMFISSISSLVAAEQSPSNSIRSSSLISDWVRARCGVPSRQSDAEGDNSTAIWIYEGALYDPLEGKRIARVQGLELISPLADCPNNHPITTSKYKERCGDLIAGKLLSSPNATFDYACTMMSRKLFCYTKEVEEEADSARGTDGENTPKRKESIMTSIRMRHKSPLKLIPTDQAVSIYETATTVIKRGHEIVTHSEWPSGRSLWGKTSIKQQLALEDNGEDNRALEFTVYTRSKKDNQQPDLLTEEPSTSESAVVSPKRSALIQFGTSKFDQRNRYGARETYSYVNIPSAPNGKETQKKQRWQLGNLFGSKKKSDDEFPCRVRYTRYGEGPLWYAPGRMCSLELRGRRASSFEELSPVLTSLIHDRIPSFLEHTKHTSFRESALQILPDPNAPPPTWLEKRHANAIFILNDASRTAAALQAKIASIWSIFR